MCNMETAKSESKTLLLMGYIMIYLFLNPGHEIDMIFFSYSLLLFNKLTTHSVSAWHRD